MKVNTIWTACSCLVLLSCTAVSEATTLAFVGFNADGTDGYSLATFEDISMGTVINFTDDEWNGTEFDDANEADWAWTATSNVAAGTVVNFINLNNVYAGTPAASASTGTVVGLSGPGFGGTNAGFSSDAEIIYAYTGTRAAPTFLAAISTASGANFGGLTGAMAIQLNVATDGAKYTGPRHIPMADFGPFLPLIADVANNWTDLGSAGDNNFDPTPFTIPEPASWSLLCLSACALTRRRR